MSEENLKACPIAYAKNKALHQLFENNFDCYTGFANEELNVEEQMAMTKDKFIEVVAPLWNTRQSPDVEGAIEEIDVMINNFNITEWLSISARTSITDSLNTIKNKLQGSQS